MKTTRIFPVHGLASLILMSKHVQSWQFFEGLRSELVYFVNIKQFGRYGYGYFTEANCKYFNKIFVR